MIPPTARLRAAQVPIGKTFQLGSHAVTEEEIIGFASAGDPQHFRVDPVAARVNYSVGSIASGHAQ